MKKVLSIGIAIMLFFTGAIYAAPVEGAKEDLPETYILIDVDTSRVLSGANINSPVDTGGMAHIMMALILLENHGLDERVSASENFESPQGESIAIDNGETFVLKDLLTTLLLISANDAAVTLAEYDAGTTEAFVDKMNEKAAALSLNDTVYKTPVDMELDGQVTSVKDIALLAAEAMKYEDFREMVISRSHVIPPTNKKEESRDYIFQKNAFVLNEGRTMQYGSETIPIYDERVTGIKVDFWSRGTYTIVTSFEYGGMNLIAVSTGEGNDAVAYPRHRALIDHALAKFKKYTLVDKGEVLDNIKVENAENAGLNLVAANSFSAVLPVGIDLEQSITKQMLKKNADKMAIEEGGKIGELTLSLNGVELGRVDAVAENAVDGGRFVGGVVDVEEEKSLLEKIFSWLIFLFKLILVFVIWTYVVGRRRRRLRRQEKALENSAKITRLDDYRWK